MRGIGCGCGVGKQTKPPSEPGSSDGNGPSSVRLRGVPRALLLGAPKTGCLIVSLLAKADELSRQLNAAQDALGRPEFGSGFPPLAAERHFDQWVFRQQSVRVGSPMM